MIDVYSVCSPAGEQLRPTDAQAGYQELVDAVIAAGPPVVAATASAISDCSDCVDGWFD